MKRGFTIIEILVVIGIFTLISIITAGGILTTLRGAKRSESDAKVKENLSFALGTIERHLRNADTVTCVNGQRINYIDQRKTQASFFLQTNGSDIYIASGSADTRLTSPDVSIVAFNVTCIASAGNTAPIVDVSITARDSASQGAESAQIQSSIKVNVRTSY
jgi:prepilin-type N-terminal cleavage/methylation domain-containing protein